MRRRTDKTLTSICAAKGSQPSRRADAAGFTLVELVVTVTVLAILSIGVAPLVKTAVKRQREQQLREALREMRDAIKQFKYDSELTSQICAQGGGGSAPNPNFSAPPSPRSRVVITDCKVFTVDNIEYYPPTLETLVEGVNVIPRVSQTGAGDPNKNATEVGAALATKKKVYLRKIPIDPMTGEADWELRSSYDAADSGSWGRENVFDVRSKSDETALNGEKYSDW